ncbi:hypothetical protein Tco_1159490 [Tanacetum coccineum]
MAGGASVIDAKKETDGKKETGGEQETTIDEKAENTAKGMIFQTLPQDMLMQVAQYTTAKEELHEMKRQEERQRARSTSHLRRRRTNIAVKQVKAS